MNLTKTILLLLISLYSFCSFSTEPADLISKEIFNNSKRQFISHQGSGRFESYLVMDINYAPVRKYYDYIFHSHLKDQYKNRGEAHITVITPIEYYDVLKSKLSMAEIEKIAKRLSIQSSKFKVICLGRGTKEINKKQEETFFIVVSSKDLIKIRSEVHKQFVKKGGDKDLFNPDKYYPHITLGFSKRDLHESDGVIKNKDSCYGKLFVRN